MNDEYNEKNSSYDEYYNSNDDFEEYEENNEDLDESGYDEEDYDDKNHRGRSKKRRGSTALFLIILLLMAALGGTYFGLKYMNADFVTVMGITAFFGDSSSDPQLNSETADENIANSISSDNEDIGADNADSINNNISDGETADADNEDVKITFGSDSRSKFAYIGNGYLYLTKDGARFYKTFDKQEWNDTYTMSSINVVTSGDYAVINDLQGRNIRLYSTSGIAYCAQTDGSIVQCTLNSQGTCAVIEKYNEDYKIQVYRNDGTLLMERFEQDSGNFPLSAALSNDSRVLAVTYVDTTGVEMKTKILLFYVNKDDTKNTATGDFFAGIEKEDMFAPYIFTMGDKVFAAVSDKGVTAVDKNGNELWNIEIPNKIMSVVHTDSGKIVLALGSGLAGENSYADGTVCIISENGKITAEYEMGEEISYLRSCSNGIVVGSGKNFVCINESAGEKWKFTATQDIKDIFACESGSKALVVTGTEAKIVDMKGK